MEQFRSGHTEPGAGYKYFVPQKINRQWQWRDPSVNKLLERAAVRLGELKAFARFVPNINLFIQLHVTKEAVISSRIEGTQTNMDEALLPEEEINPEKRNDWHEVRNYTNAMNQALADLNSLPISSRLLCKAHKLLLANARGEHKMPGEFRSSQNWIGGVSIDDAIFIPPHHKYVHELMGDLENFLHNDSIDVPELIRIGIAHYQFETIHPFLDGNGRIGRLLIPLYLVSEGLLEKPLLYLSVFFEQNRTLYYDNLNNVRTKHDMLQWIRYFLVGIEQTSANAIRTLTSVLDLKLKMESDIQQNFGRRAHTAFQLMQSLFEDPYTTTEKAAKTCSLSYKSANDLIAMLLKKGYLAEVTGQSRNRIFVFEPYLDAFR
ncbi:MAG: Fic family protein [Candidatus Cyclonatronum sp.]|uniref:Fic family protein n=1 Tax=Cyclonatronum sp. TaxID=3024185 RepID=UPI0025B96B44|nr:Fic family protein [Cyclonatronum sp.]MCH8487484.1 Fic family protein [Cyclonatronum sp.]